MSTINDGGPAYPSMRDMRHNPDFDHEPGMSLRDAFAMKAMQAVQLGQPELHDFQHAYDRIATHAYKMADAMLRAREQS